MAWSDDIRCLHCDGKLPLFRKITSGQFCSAVHRKAYWQEQERLAVERLHQTHTSLRAYRPPGALQATTLTTAASEPVGLDRYYLADQADQAAQAELQAEVEEIARSASNTGEVKFGGFITEDKPGLRAWTALVAAWDAGFAQWPMSAPWLPPHVSEWQEPTLAAADSVTIRLLQATGSCAAILRGAEQTTQLEFAPSLAQLAFARSLPTGELSEHIRVAHSVAMPFYHALRCGGESRDDRDTAGAVTFSPESVVLPQQPRPRSCAIEAAQAVETPLYPLILLAEQERAGTQQAGWIDVVPSFTAQVALALAPETEVLNRASLESLLAAESAAQSQAPAVEEEPPPFIEQLAALPRIASQEAAFAVRAIAPEPQPALCRVENANWDATIAMPALGVLTGLEPLALSNAPRNGSTQGSALAEPSALDADTGAPRITLAIAAAAPRMRLAVATGHTILSGLSAPPVAGLPVFEPVQALELRSETAVRSKQLVSQPNEPRLNPARDYRYDSRSRPGALETLNIVQGAGAVKELALVPPPCSRLAMPYREFLPGSAGPCRNVVGSAAGLIAPVNAPQPMAAAGRPSIASLPSDVSAQEIVPAMAHVQPLAFTGKACAPPAPQPAVKGVAPVYASNAPLYPSAKWEPRDGSATPPPRQGFLAGWTSPLSNGEERKHVWAHATDFWQHAPRDLKLLSIAIPILLALALRPSLPKVSVTAPATTGGISRNIGAGFRRQFVNVRNSVAERAAVSLNEDFRSGLDDWQTRGDLSTGWSFDGSGFVRPGTLALYRPSLGLGDYQMEFLGLIDKKALSWVVRAKDFDNYYVVKLVVMKAGPLPTIGITRYAVIDGKAQARVDTVASINARPDMLYRVSLDVHDDTYLLALQGTIVDNWTESRLKRGGVGFFAPRGEESRLRWLQITHQYDMLGRLCAYLAPYNIPTTNGSW